MGSAFLPPIPSETVNAARAVLGASNFYLVIGDQANRLLIGLHPAKPFVNAQKPYFTQTMFSLVTIFQFLETLPDLQVPDALRKRLDWKYALHLPLRIPVLEPSLFCEYRRYLQRDTGSSRNFEQLLANLSKTTEWYYKTRLQLEADPVITRVCTISRLAQVWSAISQVLEALAISQPEMLRQISLPHWYERYSRYGKAFNLAVGNLELESFAQAVGVDGAYLLKAIADENRPGLTYLPEILSMNKVWCEQFTEVDGKVSWRKSKCSGCQATCQ